MIKELNNLFEEILLFAERNQVCLRKAVGCAAISFHREMSMEPFMISMEHNGPSREGYECTNEVGNCGCSHSEPRIIQKLLRQQVVFDTGLPIVLVCTYSPCTNCANIVIDSGLFCGIIYDILTEHDKRGEKFLREAINIMTKEELNQMTEEDASATIKKWLSSSVS